MPRRGHFSDVRRDEQRDRHFLKRGNNLKDHHDVKRERGPTREQGHERQCAGNGTNL
jgi:hypothetical protein